MRIALDTFARKSMDLTGFCVYPFADAAAGTCLADFTILKLIRNFPLAQNDRMLRRLSQAGESG